MTERNGGRLILVLDTSSAAIGAGVAEVSLDAVRMLAERTVLGAGQHAEVLTPAIGEILAESGITPADLDAVVAGDGPGPFTGLRVGLASAAAYSDALGIPAYGVCSLDAIAAAVRADGPLLVAADARRREVYWAVYGGSVPAEPAVDAPARVAEQLAGVRAMAGAGAELYRDVLGLPLLDQPYPDLGSLVAGAAERIRAGAPGEILQPRYLRHPDATPPGARKAVTPA
ncbi:MAG TPA: tRNA (adenosine(37)-N6)-threonylcarbamoyltransferase complex dimerization subunit type 1 TsaB [Mycobacteriales bacterium]|nr:tRNA (adenosine(37)-N6)-threonylcarbamoyltransferase complex dimerization subunit type 1 TsaB [Mycobacteriales bacterium]